MIKGLESTADNFDGSHSSHHMSILLHLLYIFKSKPLIFFKQENKKKGDEERERGIAIVVDPGPKLNE